MRWLSGCGIFVALLLLTACSGGTPTATGPDEASTPTSPTSPTAATSGTYVALGDSAASGLGIAPQAPGACGRSTRAYPPLLAERRGLELDNRTCAGDRIADIFGTSTEPGATQREPQGATLDEDTTLVTVMIGANDLGFAGLIGASCSGARAGSESAWCLARDPEAQRRIGERLQEIGEEARVMLTEVVERAPNARVLLVGYGDPLGEAGPCPALPVTEEAFALARTSVAALNAELRDAAEAAGAEFVDTFTVTRGHGVCDPDPWTNGFTSDGDGAVGHPRSAYHAAIADHLDAVLG